MEFVGTVTHDSVFVSRDNGDGRGGFIIPRSNVKGSLATRTISAPLSRRSIWYSPFLAPILPCRARRVVQARSFVSPAADVSRAHDAIAVRDSKVEQAPRINILVLDDTLWNVGNEIIDLFDRLEHALPEHGRTKSTRRRHGWIMAHLL